MHCNNCGKEIKDSAKFCPKCGAKQEVTPLEPLVQDIEPEVGEQAFIPVEEPPTQEPEIAEPQVYEPVEDLVPELEIFEPHPYEPIAVPPDQEPVQEKRSKSDFVDHALKIPEAVLMLVLAAAIAFAVVFPGFVRATIPDATEESFSVLKLLISMFTGSEEANATMLSVSVAVGFAVFVIATLVLWITGIVKIFAAGSAKGIQKIAIIFTVITFVFILGLENFWSGIAPWAAVETGLEFDFLTLAIFVFTLLMLFALKIGQLRDARISGETRKDSTGLLKISVVMMVISSAAFYFGASLGEYGQGKIGIIAFRTNLSSLPNSLEGFTNMSYSEFFSCIAILCFILELVFFFIIAGKGFSGKTSKVLAFFTAGFALLLDAAVVAYIVVLNEAYKYNNDFYQEAAVLTPYQPSYLFFVINFALILFAIFAAIKIRVLPGEDVTDEN